MLVVDLGLVPYQLARSVQEEAVAALQQDSGQERLIICEHPAVLTCGRRTLKSDAARAERFCREHEIEMLQVSRGGELTFHAPGQLVIYPVVNLRKRRLGIRKFVEQSLSVMAESLKEFVPAVTFDLTPPGIYLKREETLKQEASIAKVGAVGLQVLQGITNHGFAVNICVETSEFQPLTFCGDKAMKPLSLHQVAHVEPELIKKELLSALLGLLCRADDYYTDELVGDSLGWDATRP